jgi:transaldolase/glucose-6-phosphate isomerase
MSGSLQLNTFRYKVPTVFLEQIVFALDEWIKVGGLDAEWSRKASVWTRSGEEKWLGWLDVPAQELTRVAELQSFVDEVRKDGFQQAVLLGMGGSSLGAEVLTKTFGREGKKKGYLDFHILDSTDPAQIQALHTKLNVEKTLFIVSSKSGGTLEPNIFYEYFYQWVKQSLGESKAGAHFVAITDPGTSLEKKAVSAKFRKVFHGVPCIGGRYSVLSDFGMVPAALMGVDVKRLLKATLLMVQACSKNVPSTENPGVQLGVLLGAAGKHRRDKITLICAEEIYNLGAWLEQLLAESTGKQGTGLIPIDREAIEDPTIYGSDRIFVYLRMQSTTEAELDSLDSKVQKLEDAGHPVARIEIRDLYNIGQEFFRWEMAVSVAGAVLRINPFDQPDVEASKIATKQLTDIFENKGALPDEVPVFETDEVQIFDDPKNTDELKKQLNASPTVSDYLRAHISRAKAGDYFAILAYLPMDAHDEAALQAMRGEIMRSQKVATCVEFGPRFLHSTGQAYKGGPNSGVFLQITCDDPVDLPIPGHKYSFSVVKAAEARGDFAVLAARRRRAMRIHLRKGASSGLETLRKEIEKAVA